MWTVPENKGITRRTAMEEEQLKLVSEGCNPKAVMSHLLLDFISLRDFFTSCSIRNSFFTYIGLLYHVPHLKLSSVSI